MQLVPYNKQNKQMISHPNPQHTMYIKFPTVTKLVYPQEMQLDQPKNHVLRKTFHHQHQEFKCNIISKTQSFKIIRLPEKNEIMNICMMTVRNKAQAKENEEKTQTNQQKNSKRLTKIFSVNKISSAFLNTYRQDSSFKNPLHVKTKSQSELKRVTGPPIKFDYFEIYPQISKIIALTFGVVVSSEQGSKVRRGRVQPSNNGFLVKQVLKNRIWWNVINEEHTKKEDADITINMIWTSHILNKKLLDKIENTNELCLKQLSQDNLISKPTFQRHIDRIINQLPKLKQLLFTEWEEKPKRFIDWINQLYPTKQVNPEHLTLSNHLINHYQITNKKNLYKNLVNYYQSQSLNPYQKIPKTFHITCFNWQEALKHIKQEQKQKVWIIKPGQFTNRGKGISVFRNLKQATDYILINYPRTQDKSLLFQEYITPLLYEERKFDIRCYMLGVQFNNFLKFYWYEEGYIRTASQKFTTKKVSRSIHLTNDAVQKYMNNYDKFQSANKLSYQELDKYCLNQTTFNFTKEILPQMKKIARDICHSVGDTNLIGNGKGYNFQIYGLDFLVDTNGKPWLCEVNTNPSLEICCSLLGRIIPELLENSFRLVTDILLPGTKKSPDYAQHFLSNNKYALIYSKNR